MSDIQGLSVFPVEVHQILEGKEEVLLDQQERDSSRNHDIIKSPYVKDEPEELLNSQNGEQLHKPENANIIKFTFVPAPMKSEEEEDKPQSTHLLQIKTEQMENGCDGEDFGERSATTYLDPERILQTETEIKSEDSSGIETDDSADWMETTEQQSGSKPVGKVKNNGRKGDKKAHRCTECGKRFRCKSYLNYHMKIHSSEKPFSCSECGKCFKIPRSLKEHMRVHTEEKPFSCSECGRGFSRQRYLTSHMRTHLKEKPSDCGKRVNEASHMLVPTRPKCFTCSDCGKRFSQKCSLNTHSRIHSGEKPYSCSECGKKFRYKYLVTNHMRGHTGDKPFNCSVCGKKCNQQYDLTCHMRCHTGEKPFKCSQCGKRFSRNENLTRHMLIHTREKLSSTEYRKEVIPKEQVVKKTHAVEKRFSCSECGKKFVHKYELINHMRSHTKEKPFSCSECDKRFSLKCTLTTHTTRIHAREKLLKCSKCVKRFVRQDSLTKHMLVHTQQERETL
ncbi:gastrula zinc finger protein XlCGF57.1-like [Cheilinus undulatus]|uniref:gastrula zinc finger protein XlCGF57.1-like n=1 Tax=Cheilinus undulatus TaxID=241271 RepID=UPI001BD5C2AD|nr:gastrula zinc finger protein XlCGF57.1-like [Cheilinus undulatus]